MTLSSFFEDEFSLHRKLAPTTIGTYRAAIFTANEFAGALVDLAALNAAWISRWVLWMERKRFEPWTIKSKLGTILTIWRYAHEKGLCEQPPKLREIRRPTPRDLQLLPVAWSKEEFGRAIAEADRVEGVFRGRTLRRSYYLGTLLRVAYETGLRRGDLYGIDIDWLAGDNTLTLEMNKTGEAHRVQLTLDTADRLRALCACIGSKPLAYPGDKKGLYYWMRTVCTKARVPYGALQQTRRTGATWVENGSPGGATRYLGHRSPGLARQFYVDPRKVLSTVSPPPIVMPPIEPEGES